MDLRTLLHSRSSANLLNSMGLFKEPLKGMMKLALCFFVVSCMPMKAFADDEVRFSVVGDVMTHQLQIDTAYSRDCKCWKFDSVFEEVKPFIESADLAIGNLETTLPGNPKMYSGYPAFGSPDSLAEALKNLGFDILATANNHSCDKGYVGLINTLDTLDRLGIQHLGTYRTKAEHEKNRILMVTKNDIKFAILNYTYDTNGIAIPKGTVVNLIEKKRIAADLSIARSLKPDVIIVMYHYGAEYLHEPDKFQKEMTALAFDEGADIVLGGHPHTLQRFGTEVVKDKYGIKKNRLFIYSLGNFVSNMNRRYVDGGIIFQFTVRKDGDEIFFEKVDYIPLWVYLERDPKLGVQFKLLPVQKYLKNDQVRKLPAISHTRLVQFYEDTVKLLGAPKGLYTIPNDPQE